MLDLIHQARDYIHMAATYRRNHVEVQGVRLSLSGVSPRMRYVMSKGYEEADAKLAEEILTPQDSVLEVGSAIGFLAIFCITRLGIENYYMVEANPLMQDAIARNFMLNSTPAPPARFVAVASEDGEVSFGINRNFWSSSRLPRAGETRVTVPAKSIPSLIGEMPFVPNTLIMDIEGGEAEIPHHHFETFDKIIIETHPQLVGAERIDALMASLQNYGFAPRLKSGGTYALTKVHR